MSKALIKLLSFFATLSLLIMGCKDKDSEILEVTCACPDFIEYQNFLPPDDSGDYYINPTDTVQLFAPIDTALSYDWSPTAYVSCIDCPNPLADPFRTTTFHVRQQVTLNGPSIEDSFVVVVHHAESVNIPNVFSPDRNHFNDEFRVLTWESDLVKTFNLKINRGSQLVFQTTDLFNGWDGRVDGNIYNCETYDYEVTVGFHSGNTVNFTGSVLLFLNDGVSCPDNPSDCAYESQFDWLHFRPDFIAHHEIEGC